MSTELERQKDNAYWERNQLVAALSKIFPAHLAKHPEEDKEWDEDWRTIVVIKLPTEACNAPAIRGYEQVHFEGEELTALGMNSGALKAGNIIAMEKSDEYYQLSWHIHDSEIPMFDHLGYKAFNWDGHSNEDKYRRLRLLKKQDKRTSV